MRGLLDIRCLLTTRNHRIQPGDDGAYECPRCGLTVQPGDTEVTPDPLCETAAAWVGNDVLRVPPELSSAARHYDPITGRRRKENT